MSSEPRTTPPAGPLTLLALVIAGATALGSLLLTWHLGHIACTLCFYQRTFALAAVAVLVVGVSTGIGRTTALSALVLPLAVGGLSVASFHVWLENNGTLECPKGLLGLGTAPQQSLVAFALLTLILLSDTWQELRPGGGWSASLGGILLGVVLAFLLILSGPALAAPPESPWSGPLNTCRRPYVEAH